jgi:hypothetical protein
MEQTNDTLINTEDKLFGEISEEDRAKIKASLEYEMTSVMLNLKGKFDRVDKETVRQNEYLEKEIEKPQLSYTAPEITVAGIGCDLPDAQVSLADPVLKTEPVQVDAIPLDLAAPKIPVLSEIEAAQIQADVQVPVIADTDPAACFPEFAMPDSEQMRTAIAEKMPELSSAFSASVLADAAKPLSLADSIRISVPAEPAEPPQCFAIPETEWNDICVNIPEASVDNSAFTIPSAELPAALVPDVPMPERINESSFLLPPPSEVQINIQYAPAQANGFQIPVMSAPAIRSTAVQDEPALPEMPDVSGAMAEILAAAKSEI